MLAAMRAANLSEGPDAAPARTIPRSPRAEATRARILDAALAEFAAHGLAGARVDEIAARADANKRMLYAYFGSKEELWLAVLEGAYAHKRERERALAVDGLPPEEAVAQLVRFNLRYTAEHPEFVALLNQENVHRAATCAVRRCRRLLPLLDTLRRCWTRGAAPGPSGRRRPVQLYITSCARPLLRRQQHTLSTIFAHGWAPSGARAAGGALRGGGAGLSPP
jgi:AcrR family transcriptional regulator